MRLYLYFKHNRPRGAGWFRFALDETKLLLGELGGLWPARPRSGGGGALTRMLRPSAWLAIEFWKIVSTRLAAPWIAHRARRACRGAEAAR
jgi:hypothetical protein